MSIFAAAFESALTGALTRDALDGDGRLLGISTEHAQSSLNAFRSPVTGGFVPRGGEPVVDFPTVGRPARPFQTVKVPAPAVRLPTLINPQTRTSTVPLLEQIFPIHEPLSFTENSLPSPNDERPVLVPPRAEVLPSHTETVITDPALRPDGTPGQVALASSSGITQPGPVRSSSEGLSIAPLTGSGDLLGGLSSVRDALGPTGSLGVFIAVAAVAVLLAK